MTIKGRWCLWYFEEKNIKTQQLLLKHFPEIMLYQTFPLSDAVYLIPVHLKVMTKLGKAENSFLRLSLQSPQIQLQGMPVKILTCQCNRLLRI